MSHTDERERERERESIDGGAPSPLYGEVRNPSASSQGAYSPI